jgi:hypothetical protein
MRAGLEWLLRAKSIRYQVPDHRSTSQWIGRLVSAEGGAGARVLSHAGNAAVQDNNLGLGRSG